MEVMGERVSLCLKEKGRKKIQTNGKQNVQ